MTESTTPPAVSLLKRTASVTVNCGLNDAFEFISSGEKLPLWLKKSGAIPGAKKVELFGKSYDHVGDKRKVIFVSGDTVVEQLLTRNPPGNYSYRVTDFSNFIAKLSEAAYAQFWFDTEEDATRITWEYGFSYRSVFARAILSLFLTAVYKKFMKNALEQAKKNLEA